MPSESRLHAERGFEETNTVLVTAPKRPSGAISFAAVSAASAAQGIVLHGSIAGLTPADALTVVLPGCGLHHRETAGELLLEHGTQP